MKSCCHCGDDKKILVKVLVRYWIVDEYEEEYWCLPCILKEAEELSE